MNFDALPGGGLLRDGLRDLAEGNETEASLLLQIAAPRLREHGFPVPPPPRGEEAPELRLYRRLAAALGDEGYPRYNALLREVVSLANALDTLAAARPS
ncbi:MAG TPA: hypothetical protein PKE47_09365 [Verrucomicrobiota bacterium]|nr:hypothetical protein [Verrucomicrobiota bacterium]